MSTSVTAHVTMDLEISEELAFRTPVELHYTSADPYAVRLTFTLAGDPPVSWVFARELLVDGVSMPTGDGDVRVSPCRAEPGIGAAPGPQPAPDGACPPDRVRIELRVGAEQAVMSMGTWPLLAFLDRSSRLVPLGRETSYQDINAALERILSCESPG
ncbi:SsgA family sporulation/cell division regulator [Streptomyces aidingensis]|nr:SsgA family sporulation/cell division regulator [Streptomyces aidingensis]